MLLVTTEIWIGAGLTVSSVAILNPSAGINISISTALLNLIAILITNEFLSKLNLRYTKLRDWINFFTILYEKTLKESMIDKIFDEKEASELKKMYNHILILWTKKYGYY